MYPIVTLRALSRRTQPHGQANEARLAAVVAPLGAKRLGARLVELPKGRKPVRSAGRQVLGVLAVLASLPASASALELTSASFGDGDVIPVRHSLRGSGCLGQNLSPALEWKDAPRETRSFAVTMFDPDAPTGSGWWHWVLINIPADVRALAEGVQPRTALATRTDFGMAGYGGPCPPAGAAPHRYVISVYALDVDSLPLDDRSSGAMAGYMINSHTLAKAHITGFFGR